MIVSPSTLARRTVLGSAGIGAVIRGLAYMPWTQGSEAGARYLSPIEGWFPLWVWGCVWMAAGVALLLSLAWRQLSIFAMSALTGLLTMWGVSYLSAWLLLDSHRSWVSGGLFLVMAVWSGLLASLLERRR